jgi:hypothetical protein
MIKIILAVQAAILSGLLLLAADLYAHKRVEMAGGVNIWGYRGAVVQRRVPGDLRVLFLGGTRAFGYGAGAGDTIGYALGWELTGRTRRPTTVIEAARIGATAPDYASQVDRFAFLEPDVVVLYDDLGFDTARPRVSKVARAFSGYEPILPLVLEEKGHFLQREDSPLRRSIGGVLQRVGRVLRDVESHKALPTEGEYANLMMAAAERALARAIVMIVVDPPVSGIQERRLEALRDRVAQRGDPRLKLLQLTEVESASELIDGYSYGGAARGRVMRAMLPELLALSNVRRP